MPEFKVNVLRRTDNPQQAIYLAMHQDYSDQFVSDHLKNTPTEAKCGQIVVKRLLEGNRGHYGCYSGDSEVLTSHGWVRFDQLTTDHYVGAVNLVRNKLVFEKPKTIYNEKLRTGDVLYHRFNNTIDLLVTHDHRVCVFSVKKQNYEIYKAKEIVNKSFKFPLTTFASAQNNTVHIPKIFNNLGVIFYDLAGRFVSNQTISNPTLLAWFNQNFRNGDGQVDLPSNFVNTPTGYFKIFLHAIISQDASIRTDNKQLVDGIQQLAHTNGVYSRVQQETKNGKHYFVIELSYSRFNESETIETVITPTEAVNVYCCTVSTGLLLVRRNFKVAICGNCLEHPSIILNCGFFPHSVVQQARTHRLLSFDVQSLRYTSRHLLKVLCDSCEDEEIENVIYLRPVGYYTDRKGHKYFYSVDRRAEDLSWCREAIKRYQSDIDSGLSEEHARGKLPFDYRQHFIVSGNMRSLMHFLDLRYKKDAQLEIQQLCELILPIFQAWSPEIYAWYASQRLQKAKLAP